ncbi:MAG: hypothetical protein GXC76_12765 [Rhodanobacteraceae bacterium]|jgi:hypothetical protein|nr:hypothetical protein [Rhodanobacteraceae bacterium]
MPTELSNTKRKNESLILKLPSVEAQLATWIQAVDQNLVNRSLTLMRGGFTVYVRKSRRTLDGSNVTTLDIASINIHERHRGRGWFRAFRSVAESLNPWDATYYECVNNQRLASYFRSARLSAEHENCFYVFRRAARE